MSQREPYDKKLKEVHRQDTRQKFGMLLLRKAEDYADGKMTMAAYLDDTGRLIVDMNAEIRDKTGGCNG